MLCFRPGADEDDSVYCSPRCRARAGGGRLTVEIDHEPVHESVVRPVGGVWLVLLCRGRQQVVVATELGRPSADHLGSQITAVISPHRRSEGAAME